MVGTRRHPNAEFPQTPTPTSSSTSSIRSPSESQTLTRRTKSVSRRSTSGSRAAWTHTPSNLTLLWLAISLPLVTWDTGYVLGRPHTMPGGKFHSQIYKPYALYGAIDYMYGWPAWTANNGFTAAQALLNVVETIGYAIYLYMVYSRGVEVKNKGRGAPKKLSNMEKATESVKRLGHARVVSGKAAVWCTILGYSTTLMTISKTVLYGLNEVCSGFHNIGHNNLFRLIFMWIIPNGAWLLLPSYMLYMFGQEIVEGLEASTAQ